MNLPIEEYFTSETGEELFLEFDCDVTPGTDEHFCNGHGNWLPGDLPEVKITAIRHNGKELLGPDFECYCRIYGESVKEKALKKMERAA